MPPIRRLLPVLCLFLAAVGCDRSARAARAAEGAAAGAEGATRPAGEPGEPGELDAGFGREGRVEAAIGPDARMYGVALQPDGSLVAVGSVKPAGSPAEVFAVGRFTAAGALDRGWGSEGVVTASLAEHDHQARAVAVQPDGRVVVAGAVPEGGAYRFAVARYTAEGAPDASFGEGGVTVTPFAYDVQPVAVAVQPDGRIIVAGTASDFDGSYFALARYHADGSLDTGFGSGGKVTTTYTGWAFDMAAQPQGGVFVAGTSLVLTGSSLGGVRYDASGRLDRGFGEDGRAWTRLESVTTGESVVVQTDGRLVVAGTTKGGGETATVAVVRFTADGEPDSAFGEAGKTTLPIRGTDLEVHAAAAPDGSVVVAAATGGELSVVRLLADGTLDAAFGEQGVARLPGGAGFVLRGLVVQENGRIVAAGHGAGGWTLVGVAP